ncbi:Pre-mRNA splicing factor SR-like 1 [Zea mays]|uniref:Pre-mRNA-splicing factor 38 n=1 Tax=Zea mays TaxID=4577 RepID=A0A3L6DQK5_MAIZE|nr:Pre-mRNA splicing factor SR-like 1 [Zea mays]
MEIQSSGRSIEGLMDKVLSVNILSSDYFKELFKYKTYHEVIDEIYNQVDHVEPWMTGNCRGPSSAFCLLYKLLFTMKLTVKQMHGLLKHQDSPYIRADAKCFRNIVRSQAVSRNIVNAIREVLDAPATADARVAKMLLAEEMKNEVSKEYFLKTVRNIVGDKLLKQAASQYQMQAQRSPQINPSNYSLSGQVSGQQTAPNGSVTGDEQKGYPGAHTIPMRQAIASTRPPQFRPSSSGQMGSNTGYPPLQTNLHKANEMGNMSDGKGNSFAVMHAKQVNQALGSSKVSVGMESQSQQLSVPKPSSATSLSQTQSHGIQEEPKIQAHFIKDRRCNTAWAVFALESECKWALSGTPLQNRVGELYSLIRFLQIFPYSYYFYKDCSCEILDTRYVDAGTLMNNYAHIFDLLTRLRQAVDHPYLVAYSKTAGHPEGMKNEGNESMESQCGICHNLAEDVVCKTVVILIIPIL